MSDGPTIEISVQSDLWSPFPFSREKMRIAIAEAIRQSRVTLRPGVEISLLLCDDQAIAALNAQWRGQQKATNVLSFPTPDPRAEAYALGDIAIAFETTAREAAEEDKSFEDHFTHLLVHGFLHLLGYDHQSDDEATMMERLESEVLAALGIADPYRAALAEIAK